MLPESVRCADSLAFFGKPGEPPVFTERPKNLNLAHLTSVRPWVSNFSEALKEHVNFVSDTLSNENLLTILRSKDTRRIQDGIGVIFGMQHAPADMNTGRMRALHALGLRIMAIAYDGPNEYGCGYMDSTSGLTDKGKDLIVDMTDCGIILDLSHASHQTAIDALDFIRQEVIPTCVMASHSGCYSVYPHPRNVKDDVLRGLSELDGYIGIPMITFFLGKEGSEPYMEFVKHVRHAQSIMDRSAVGIGSDSPYQDMTLEDARGHFEKMISALKPDDSLGFRFPDRPECIIEHGSNLFSIMEGHVGYDRSVLGESFMNFLKKALD